MHKKIRICNGYRVVYQPDHPNAMSSDSWKGYVYEHIYVMSKEIDRPLCKGEVVHHLDGNRDNNRKSNLILLTSSHHSRLHCWIKNTPSKVGLNFKEAATKINKCQFCDSPLDAGQIKYCSRSCAAKLQNVKHNKPTKEELVKDIQLLSREAVGRKYGVTGNAVKKWQYKYGLL